MISVAHPTRGGFLAAISRATTRLLLQRICSCAKLTICARRFECGLPRRYKPTYTLLPLAITRTLCALTDAKPLNFGVTTVKERRFSCRCPEGFACTTPTSSYAIGAKWRSSVARPANPKRHPTTPRFSFDYFNLLTS